MAETTGISWCRSTFNPWVGCTEISTEESGGGGCDHCYARALDARHKWGGATHWGAGVPRYRTSAANWAKPLAWNKAAHESTFAGRKGFWPVFCASLADVFDNEVPNEWREDLWALIERTPNLSWLLVTKRVGNVAKMVPERWMREGFPPHVRLLITVVNQKEADRDVPKLLALPCKNGVSYEPALSLIDWSQFQPFCRSDPSFRGVRGILANQIQWLICGGESDQPGHKARPFDLAWARSTIAQGRTAGVPVFVKQLGSRPYDSTATHIPVDVLFIKDRAGADLTEFPADCQVREFPQ